MTCRDCQTLVALVEAGDRLSNIVENSVPAQYRDKAILRNALAQWDEAVEATMAPVS